MGAQRVQRRNVALDQRPPFCVGKVEAAGPLYLGELTPLAFFPARHKRRRVGHVLLQERWRAVNPIQEFVHVVPAHPRGSQATKPSIVPSTGSVSRYTGRVPRATPIASKSVRNACETLPTAVSRSNVHPASAPCTSPSRIQRIASASKSGSAVVGPNCFGPPSSSEKCELATTPIRLLPGIRSITSRNRPPIS